MAILLYRYLDTLAVATLTQHRTCIESVLGFKHPLTTRQMAELVNTEQFKGICPEECESQDTLRQTLNMLLQEGVVKREKRSGRDESGKLYLDYIWSLSSS